MAARGHGDRGELHDCRCFDQGRPACTRARAKNPRAAQRPSTDHRSTRRSMLYPTEIDKRTLAQRLLPNSPMNEKVTDRTAKIIALLQERVRLEPFHRRLLYGAFGILWSSGALWLVIEWFKGSELGVTRTPLQTLSMKIHGASMLIYLGMLGSLMTHVRRGMALKANRISGFSVIGLNGVLLLTGWLLYYASDDALRWWSSTIHWTVGIGSLALLCGHVWLGRGWASRHFDGGKNTFEAALVHRAAVAKAKRRRNRP
jgi:hypothetical protein